MKQNDSDFLPLRVTHTSPDGKRSYDRGDKQRLIEACLQPGISVAGMALKAGVNANLLRRWICRYQDKRNGTVAKDISGATPAAFMPVVEVGPVEPKSAPSPARPDHLAAHREPVRASQRSPLPSRLVAQLPNGVSVELECSGQDGSLVAAMIETLGRCHVPARR
jgi:transposase